MAPQKTTVSRRGFLGASALLAVVPCHVLGGPGKKPPSDTLNVAGVGLGAMGIDNLKACTGENVAALCDVDSRMASVTFLRYPKATRYKDYRRMLEKESGIDAVIVATPDHTHGVITAAAMRSGKHVYTQMPLAHDVWEARQLTEIARKTGVATQMGNERFSGPTLRSTVEWIQDGCIGPVAEVHCWTNRPQWPQDLKRPAAGAAPPGRLDWDLWLGPVAARAYHRAYHPYRWRGWRDFGTGALGAVGCHVMDGAFWALELADAPTITVEADADGGSAESFPKAATIRYCFPARGDMPPVTLTWYDGGRRPPRPKAFPETREILASNGTIFMGEKGMLTFGAITAGTNPGQAGPRFIPESLRAGYKPPKSTIPRVSGVGKWVKSSRHVQEWVRACKGKRKACSNFEVAGPLTELVLLGNVALRAGGPITWDRKQMKVSNDPKADALLRRPYRDGWSL